MKRILHLIPLLVFLDASAQDVLQPKLRGHYLYGRISKIEYRTRNVHKDKNGDFVESPAVDGGNFYYDENMKLIKEEQYIDYTRLDPLHKTKVKIIPVELTPEIVEKPQDTTYQRTDSSLMRIVPYDGTGRFEIYTERSKPGMELWTFIDKTGKVTGRQMRVYQSNGKLKYRAWYEGENYEKLGRREEYDEQGNRTYTRQYRIDKWDDILSANLLKYDAHGNVVFCEAQELDRETGKLVTRYTYYWKYTYAKGDPGPQKETAKKEESIKEGGEEKKSVFDKINPFKKKNKEDQQ